MAVKDDYYSYMKVIKNELKVGDKGTISKWLAKHTLVNNNIYKKIYTVVKIDKIVYTNSGYKQKIILDDTSLIIYNTDFHKLECATITI